jgi:molybdate transport system substrate-binding protein
MKRFVLIILLVAALLAACGPVITTIPVGPTSVPPIAVPPTAVPRTLTPVPPTEVPQPRNLTVFAAASLTDAFKEIGKNFEAANPGVTVTFNFAGSSTLSTQLIQGASADVFASANKMEMDKVVASSLIQAGTPVVFVKNILIVILAPNNPGDIQTLQDLARPGLKLDLADKTVPVGKYALQALDLMVKDPSFSTDFKTKVLANVVSYETDVKQVVAKVQLGEADAGIVYISDSIAAPELKTIAIPTNLNVVATYPIAALTNAHQLKLAYDFDLYLLSSDGQAILKKWGFTPITP